MKHTQIGIRMHDLGQLSPAQLAQKLSAYNLDCGQLAIQKSIEGIQSYHDVSEQLLAEINTAFAEQNIKIAVLGCYIEPVHPDAERRQHQLDNFAAAISCAAFLDAGCVATETPLSGRQANTHDAFADLCRSVEFMLEKAKPLGVTVALEPVRYDVLCSPEITYQFLQRFKGEDVGIIFDEMNLLHPGQAEQQEAFWRECFDAFGKKLVACHIKDAQPSEDGAGWQACVLGHGVFRYGEICAQLKSLGAGIPILRENFSVAHASEELAFLESLRKQIQQAV